MPSLANIKAAFISQRSIPKNAPLAQEIIKKSYHGDKRQARCTIKGDVMKAYD